ncbi:MAG: carbonic anhydrase [Caulobacterales bacterium]
MSPDVCAFAATALAGAAHLWSRAAMQDLIEGYRRYRQGRWPTLKALHEQLAERQRPGVLIIACCDSRVDPATIFDADPGQLFVIRNVANLAPPYEEGGGYHGTSAAIEFAVTNLEVATILVLGHARCGGVTAALGRPHKHVGQFLDPWVDLLEPAKKRIASSTSDPQTALEHESIKVTLENLMTFPFVAERVKAGKLALQGARYGIADGGLEILDPKTGDFEPVV